jgi:hypothetical protein
MLTPDEKYETLRVSERSLLRAAAAKMRPGVFVCAPSRRRAYSDFGWQPNFMQQPSFARRQTRFCP